MAWKPLFNIQSVYGGGGRRVHGICFRNFTGFKEAGSQFSISTTHTCRTQILAKRQPVTIV